MSFLKEKLRGSGHLKDNKCLFINRRTVYEKLSHTEVDKIRHMIHEEFSRFIKKKGGPRNRTMDAEFPSYGNLIDMNTKDSLGWTPFMNACTKGHKGAAFYLLLVGGHKRTQVQRSSLQRNLDESILCF